MRRQPTRRSCSTRRSSRPKRRPGGSSSTWSARGTSALHPPEPCLERSQYAVEPWCRIAIDSATRRPLAGRRQLPERLPSEVDRGETVTRPLPDPVDHSHREERVAAEVEETVIEADALDGERLAPDVRQHPFRRAARRHEAVTGHRGVLLRWR